MQREMRGRLKAGPSLLPDPDGDVLLGLGSFLAPPIVRSVGVMIESSKDKVVLTGDYSAPGDELNRLTRIPVSMVRAVRTLEKKPYLGE